MSNRGVPATRRSLSPPPNARGKSWDGRRSTLTWRRSSGPPGIGSAATRRATKLDALRVVDYTVARADSGVAIRSCFRRGLSGLPGGIALSTLVVIGAQWGDEAKGKIVDLAAQDADVVVRYGGGSNAGHTVTVGDLQLKLHLIPSGILNPRATCILSDGSVIDPSILLSEVKELRDLNIDVSAMKISPHAHVVMPYHKEFDRLEEA